ncbi:hypothetical protein GCM10011374_27110 [Kocuria dechangensis]|uniref:Alpha/beta hydrolase n=1 Tax=Kocuria dechangensis TaxID=1176249 RepID=A0A917GZD7_9MICC|nr:hypothetical protein [Kocuria dechangensis]GGG62495.1 hypothetical protein GCM10011374_27110 [Kocuria dechangensis]
MAEIHFEHWGEGPPVMLVHGSIAGGASTWAAQRPHAARWRLVVVDRRGYFPNPPAEREDFEVDAGDIAELLTEPMHLVEHGPGDPAEFLRAFIAHVGSSFTPPDPLPPPLLQNARLLRHERPTDEAQIPLDALRAAPFPKLVVSGGHSPVFDAVCHALELRLGASRAVVRGAGHSVQRTGAAYNDVLERFLSGDRVLPGTTRTGRGTPPPG